MLRYILVVLRVEIREVVALAAMTGLIEVARGRRYGLQASEPFVDIRGEPTPRVLAVVGYVNASGDLVANDGAHAVANVAVELRGIVRLVERARLHAFDDGARADEAAAVGGEDALVAAVHGQCSSMRLAKHTSQS